MNFDLTTLLIAFATGMVPTFFWLYFWLGNDKKRPEPKYLLTLSFLIGGIAVAFSYFIQKLVSLKLATDTVQFVFISSIVEEVMKFIFIAIFIFPNKSVDEPIDYAIYLGTAGLGFAAFENTLFLLSPASSRNLIEIFAIGNSRFIGATVLHAVTAILIGVFIGRAKIKQNFSTVFAICRGLLLAIVLHLAFNLTIIVSSELTRIVSIISLWLIGLGLIHYIHILRKKSFYQNKLIKKSKK